MIFGFSMPPQSVIVHVIWQRIFTAGEQQILYVRLNRSNWSVFFWILRFRRKLKCRRTNDYSSSFSFEIATYKICTYWFFVHNLSRSQVSAGTFKHTYHQNVTYCSMPQKIGRGFATVAGFLLLFFTICLSYHFIYYCDNPFNYAIGDRLGVLL